MFGLSDDLYAVTQRMKKAGDKLAMVLSAYLSDTNETIGESRSEYVNDLLKAWEDSKEQKEVWK